MTRTKAAMIGFQFTLPRGERRNILAPLALTKRFNSRSRGGSDLFKTACSPR